MNIRCRLHRHDWRTVSIHVGMTVGDRETTALITRCCERCGEQEVEPLHNCWIALDIAPGKPPSDGWTNKPRHVEDGNRSQKNAAAIRLLDKWLADKSGYDDAVWPGVKKRLQEAGFLPEDDEGDVRPEFAERLQRQEQRVKAGDKGTPLCDVCGDDDGDCWPVRGCA